MLPTIRKTGSYSLGKENTDIGSKLLNVCENMLGELKGIRSGVFGMEKRMSAIEKKLDIKPDKTEKHEPYTPKAKGIDLVSKYFRIPNDNEPRVYLTSTMIQTYIVHCEGVQISSKTVGSALQKMGVKCATQRINQKTNLGYFLPLQNYYEVVEITPQPELVPKDCYVNSSLLLGR